MAIKEYIIDEGSVTSETKKEKKPAVTASSWAGIFAQDVPEKYFRDGTEEVDGVQVPKLLPKAYNLRKYYIEANKLGLGFNVYALARTLKSERGSPDGPTHEYWRRFSEQYKAIGSMVLCRMLGYGGISPKAEEMVDDVHMFGIGKGDQPPLSGPSTGLVKLVVAEGKATWGTNAFATDKSIKLPKDQFIVSVASKILSGEYFIGDKIFGAVSFYHVQPKPSEADSVKPSKINKANKWLYTLTPYCGTDNPEKYPSKSMGEKAACWTGPLDGAGLETTQIRMFTRMPMLKTDLRSTPSRLPWCDRDLPRIAEPKGFDIARTKLKWLRSGDDGAESLAQEETTSKTTIEPYKQYQTLKDVKGDPIPSVKGFFVMDGNMVNAFRRVTNIDLAMTASYVKLFHHDKSSGKNRAINVHFLDSNIQYDEKNIGRPKAALVGVDITTQESANTFITLRVDIRLKVFDKSALDFPDGILAPFFYPEYPFGIEYGYIYNGDNADPVVHTLLNWKEIKLCNPTSYDLTIDEKGIYEFVIHAIAGPEHAFNKMYVGSFTMKSASPEDKKKYVDPYVSAVQKFEKAQGALAEKEKEEDNQEGKQKSKTLPKEIKKLKAEEEKASLAAQKALSEYIAERMSALNEKLVAHPHYTNTKVKGQTDKGKKKWVSVGDVIRTLCLKDIEEALQMYSTGKEQNVALVWGRFNENCGDWAGESMDKFLIPFEDFKKKLAEEADIISQSSFRLDFLLSKIMSYYLDETTYRNDPDKAYEGFRPCQAVDYIEHTLRAEGEYIQYVIADRAYGVDFCNQVTQHFEPIYENNGQTTDVVYPSVGERKHILEDRQVAYIQMLDAGSFAKSIKFQAEMDEHIVKISLEKIMGYTTSSADLEHNTVAADKLESQAHTTKIRQILRGTIDLWGHPLWQPMKCFYMFADSQEHDGWYQILNVHHSYSVGLPTTTIEVFFYLYS